MALVREREQLTHAGLRDIALLPGVAEDAGAQRVLVDLPVVHLLLDRAPRDQPAPHTSQPQPRPCQALGQADALHAGMCRPPAHR